MLKILIKIISILIISAQLISCGYTNVKVPLDKDVNNTDLGDKIGYSSSKSIAWLVAWGDAGTKTAALNGNIETITHLDAQYFSILFGLYSKRTTIAYGR